MVKSNSSKKHLGQITVRNIGKKYIVCVSGTPEKLFDTINKAKDFANKLRLKLGRRPNRKN